MKRRKRDTRPTPLPTGVRIIGGSLRGRMLPFSGDPRTRPMKDRVREAVFNLLADNVVGLEVIDLFAGTGALGFEALSRGAARATFVERHVPTAKQIQRIAQQFGLEHRTAVVSGDAFFWIRHDWVPSSFASLLFCSPPYRFFVERRADMIQVIEDFLSRSAPGSCVVVESDEHFDVQSALPEQHWFVRRYPPAVVALSRRG